MWLERVKTIIIHPQVCHTWLVRMKKIKIWWFIIVLTIYIYLYVYVCVCVCLVYVQMKRFIEPSKAFSFAVSKV